MNLSKLALLSVVFVDVLGQGLIFPIINTLVMDRATDFLPSDTAEGTRHFYYGLVIGIFFLAWFLGAVYISKLSDSLGRKRGILICLAGALAGYVLTIVSLAVNSLWLLILGRAITGFTAGNQPIAQAAMVDLSRDDAEKTRNMGYLVSSFSISLVVGPIAGGVLSDKDLIGDIASLSLPFYFAIALILVSAFLVVFFFEEKLKTRTPLRIGPLEVFRLLWQVRERPTVMRISTAFFFFMMMANAYYVFMDNYISSRFDIGTFGTSMAMLVLGACLALSSALLVSAVGERFSKRTIVITVIVSIALSAILFVLTPSVAVTYLAILPFGLMFGIGYPTLLSIFSASVDESEQGWVMGVSTALFTLGAGSISLVGGELMALNIRYPFFVCVGAAVLALILIATVWRAPDVRKLIERPDA